MLPLDKSSSFDGDVSTDGDLTVNGAKANYVETKAQVNALVVVACGGGSTGISSYQFELDAVFQ